MLWQIGCLYGAASVAFGAFGAHGLRKRISDPQKLANWSTAAHYQLVHSGVVLIATSIVPKNKLASGLFIAGMTMFSGSIYLLVLDPQRFKALGPVTPLGGLCLIAGWVALGFASRGRLTL
ncbi:uncharacterized protein A1O9_11011 [Exophiala aquamarina CBS 119918]|uniref:DUF423-domain-containing protein n=1 Tax=Exophiala aquamarina CBS 119918 TaxID=1182545 RepID=A0A072P1F3_9EURO|nr:uncharacterized protein A1O9_11011 [Exophiala aquamarina CBS 119918]KEF53103.1 hypothetical protein A1O9_11011 [Exophiala aquamarina CBS 119918]